MKRGSQMSAGGDPDELEQQGLKASELDLDPAFDPAFDPAHESESADNKGGALDPGGMINIWEVRRIGYIAQYFAVGFVSGTLPATIYGLFLGYLNTPTHIYQTASVVTMLPWSFKFLFGMLNDCVPIQGFHRKPYMVIGWSWTAVMLLILATWGLPEPYWCTDKDGFYVTEQHLASGSRGPAPACNESASRKGGQYALLMALATLGYLVADVAADGLTVQYARREATERRGATQTFAYTVRSVGSALSSLLVGFGMNAAEYNGTFGPGVGFTFNQICAIVAVPSAAMIPISWYLVEEPEPTDEKMSFGKYASMTSSLLRSRAMFWVVCFQFLSSAIGNISSTAGGGIKEHWAGVKNLQNQLFSLFGQLLFASGLYLVKSRFLGSSWRVMLLSTTLILICIDVPFCFLTIFDVVRNQYFYLGETVLIEIPAAANFVVSTFVVVEMAESGNAGLVYGLLTTTSNLGGPVANAISVQVFRLFEPSLSDAANFIKDTPEFRNTVAMSMLLSYVMTVLSMGLLPLLPDQKEETQLRKRTWPRHDGYLVATTLLVGLGLLYSLAVNLLSMFESTMCLEFAGGDGCD